LQQQGLSGRLVKGDMNLKEFFGHSHNINISLFSISVLSAGKDSPKGSSRNVETSLNFSAFLIAFLTVLDISKYVYLGLIKLISSQYFPSKSTLAPKASSSLKHDQKFASFKLKSKGDTPLSDFILKVFIKNSNSL